MVSPPHRHLAVGYQEQTIFDMLKNWTERHQSGETGRRERVAKWRAEAMPGGMFVHPPGTN